MKDKRKEKIIIHQMGKVGLSTVYETIKSLNLNYAVYHLHWLSQDGIKRAFKYFKNTESGKVPMHIRRSSILQKYIDFNHDKLKIISITREPISRFISDFFQNIHYNYPSLITEGQLDNNIINKLLFEKFETLDLNNDYTLNWFDDEFLKSYNVDIYSYPFDKDLGYTIIKNNNIEILIIRMEDINKNLNIALKEFLNVGYDIMIINTNIGNEKEFAHNQNFLKTNLKIPKCILESILETKYFKHFYNDEAKQKVIEKWDI